MVWCGVVVDVPFRFGAKVFAGVGTRGFGLVEGDVCLGTHLALGRDGFVADLVVHGVEEGVDAPVGELDGQLPSVHAERVCDSSHVCSISTRLCLTHRRQQEEEEPRYHARYHVCGAEHGCESGLVG